MAKIQYIKDASGNKVYPVTHERAVKDSAGVSLETKLSAIDAKTYVVAWDGASSPVVADIPAGVVVEYSSEEYTGTLAASDSTAGKVYLVSNEDDEYDRYVTSVSGTTYSWVQIGSTAMTLEVVNDLTTGGTTKALSAEMGKTLEGEVAQTSGIVNSFVDWEQGTSPNIFDKSKATDGRAIYKDSGGSSSASNYCHSDYIPIPEGTTSIYINNSYGGGSWGYACYNSSKEYTHGSNSYATSPSIQSGDAYLRFTMKLTDKDTCMAVIGTSADLPSEYVPYGTLYESELKDDSVPFDAISFKKTVTGKNKLNPDDVSTGFYINRNTGSAASSSAGMSATGFIEVSQKGLYFNAYYKGGTAIGAAVYNASKQYIREISKIYTYVDGDAYVRYSFYTSDLATAQVEEGGIGTAYEAYTEREVIDPQYVLSSGGGEGGGGELKVFLPDKLYAVVGDTLQIFFQSLVRVVDVSNYDVRVSCSKGKQYHRYFEYTPSNSDIGTTSFSITVIDDYGNTVGTATSSLITVAQGGSPATNKNILCIGSSTTANGKWPAEAYRRLTGTGGTPAGLGKTNITFCGTATKDGAGYTGRSGWGWEDFCTAGRPAFRFTIGSGPNVAMLNEYSNNGHTYKIIEISDDGTILCSTSSASNTPQASGTLTLVDGTGDAEVAYTEVAADSQNPFWDYTNNKLTFVPFANTYCNGTIDAIYIWLGMNGSTAWQTDWSEARGYIETFADTLHAEFPSATLTLFQATMPSMKLMMPTYGASGTGAADTFGVVDKVFNMRAFYQDFVNDDDYSSFVDFVDGVAQFDTDYNFAITYKAVNTRNTAITEPYDNNTVHPGDTGYMQAGDSAFRHMVAKFCQS